MENQHRKIAGYRELSQEEIDLMNAVKQAGQVLEKLITQLWELESIDKHWLAMGNSDLQVGIMKLVRAIAKPTTF